jgi:large subunit ribosomal protein L35
VGDVETGAQGARLYAAENGSGFGQERIMPKIKTHKATSKRFKRTASGKIHRLRIGKSHLRRKKPSRLLRSLDKTVEVTNVGNVRRVKRLLPYLAKKD